MDVSVQEVAYFYQSKDGVDYLFVDHPSYHRPGTHYWSESNPGIYTWICSINFFGTLFDCLSIGNPYGDTRGPFGDNQFRYTLLSLAACEAPLRVPLNGYTYGESVCFIANDCKYHWRTLFTMLAICLITSIIHSSEKCFSFSCPVSPF